VSTTPAPIALTAGEPAGIGPDVVLALTAAGLAQRVVVVTDPAVLEARARRLRIPVRLREMRPGPALPAAPLPGEIEVLPVPFPRPEACGAIASENAAAVVEALRLATRGCLDGRFSALVTGPVHKGAINDAGIPFTGHTELLAEASGARQPVMMLAAGSLRVALATTHLPLARVSAALSRALIESVLRVLDADLRRWFDLAEPRILVCGLNPHAGEGGHLGDEEQTVIAPALRALAAEGLCVEGPVPADTAFTPTCLERADAVLAMYHDQGLPVVKHAGFGAAVNVTLGLPFVRTSVDHGTALELAGSGRADAGSLAAALRVAAEMRARRLERVNRLLASPS